MKAYVYELHNGDMILSIGKYEHCFNDMELLSSCIIQYWEDGDTKGWVGNEYPIEAKPFNKYSLKDMQLIRALAESGSLAAETLAACLLGGTAIERLFDAHV